MILCSSDEEFVCRIENEVFTTSVAYSRLVRNSTIQTVSEAGRDCSTLLVKGR